MQLSSTDSNASLRLTALDESFGGRLQNSLGELSRALQDAERSSGAFRRAKHLSHQIRGTAVTYGYQGVGDLVEIIDETLARIDERPLRPDFLWERARSSLRDAMRLAELGPDVAPPQAKSRRTSVRTLLVIDDDEDFLRLMRGLGRRHSMSVVTAPTVEQGLTAVEGVELSAVILDVHLVDECSFSAVEDIRKCAKNSELPIIFASADGSLETRLSACGAGANRFLDKPLSPQRFSELLHQVPFCDPPATRIVILDDDEIVLERYESELRSAGHFVCGVNSPDELLRVLDDVRPDALLLDVNLDHLSGIEVCRALRASERWQFLPILMFSGDRDTEMRVRAYQAGASDVLAKPLAIEELITRVTVQAERVRFMRERSDRDSLSGVMLRRAFVDAIQRALASCGREKKPLATILFDLDRFKEINDTHGHHVGDRVIAAFGELLRSRFRLEDLRGRWGGEEFVLAFPGQDTPFAVSAAERILSEFGELEFEGENGETFRASFTAGVASFPRDGESLDLLIKRADQRLYEGKEAGRGMVIGDD